MSETRSSFHVPAPRADGASTDADQPDATGDPGRPPEEPRDTDTTAAPSPGPHPVPDAHTGTQAPGTGTDPGADPASGEGAWAARWPVPENSEPPTGAWDRHRPRSGEQQPGPLWPVAEQPEQPQGRGHRGRPVADDDPETFTFDRPAWPEQSAERPAWPGPAVERPAETTGPRQPPAQGPQQAPAQGPRPGVPGAPAREDQPPGDQTPTPSDGFSYWERRPLPAGPPGHAGAAVAAPPVPAWGRGEQPRVPAPSSAGGWEQAEETPAPRASRTREPYLDNVKFVLIALVVTGHSLVPTLSAHSSRSAYLFIYVFHMPLFVIISGYLSRNFWNSNAKTNKLVDTFLVPYVIVEIGYALLRFAFGHKWSLTIIDPAWLNWYLLALLLWRLSTPVWKRMRHPLPIAVAVYLLAGLSDLPGDFSMDRFFGLMPFFVLGLWLQPRHFEMLNRRWVKAVAVAVLAGGAAVAIVLAPYVKLAPVYYKDSYADLSMPWWIGMAMRGALLIAALAMSMAILALVPRRSTWFSDLGTRTLYCYLLHGIPVYIAKEMGWLEFPWLHGPLGVMAIVSSCFALAIVLCLPETRAVFKYVLEPRLTWLYRRPSADARPAAS
ncbi:acyltransferase family protein [Sphaerisporangium aureirubrum]|uniref:Acyltransferase family protein n=1 Tax=Sphaerisporangium aureirubrum TaxID=1544736 RepID=A0ABW1NBY1_9ACTN